MTEWDERYTLEPPLTPKGDGWREGEGDGSSGTTAEWRYG